MTAKEREYFLSLRDSVVGCDVMVDKLVIKDVQLTAANDDNYFVFEDTILQVTDRMSNGWQTIFKAPSYPLRRSCCASVETPTSWLAGIPLAAARRGHSSGRKGKHTNYHQDSIFTRSVQLSYSVSQESQRAVGWQPAGPRGGLPAQRGRPFPRVRPLLRPILLRLLRQVSCHRHTCAENTTTPKNFFQIRARCTSRSAPSTCSSAPSCTRSPPTARGSSRSAPSLKIS